MNISVLLIFLLIPLIHLEETINITYPVIVNLIEIKGEPSILRSDDLLNKVKALNSSYELATKRHIQRMHFILEHAKQHHMSCLFLYKEVLRMKTTGKIMNRGREIIKKFDQMRQHGTNEENHARESFVECFKSFRAIPTSPPWFTQHKPNNLIIHHIKDPYNDNVQK